MSPAKDSDAQVVRIPLTVTEARALRYILDDYSEHLEASIDSAVVNGEVPRHLPDARAEYRAVARDQRLWRRIEDLKIQLDAVLEKGEVSQ